MESRLGLDAGSTTVKVVLWRDGLVVRSAYLRHHGDPLRAAGRALAEVAPAPLDVRPFLTGSAARLLAARWQAPIVHEVSAVAGAASRRHPRARTIVELGGQDAKLVMIEPDPAGGSPRAHMTMNDRCAAGTGVTIDRCLLRLDLSPERAATVAFDPARVRPLSAKCGVFAETDLVNLARAGAPPEVLVASLADAIVAQNLAVLARGVTPRPLVLLLGGPHVYLPAIVAAWRHRLAARWREPGAPAPVTPEAPGAPDVLVPADALLFAAIGACEVGAARHPDAPAVSTRRLAAALDGPRALAADVRLDTPLVDEPARSRPRAPHRRRGPRAPGAPYLVGIDAGSTACKAVVTTLDGELLAARGRRSVDPVGDARELLAELERTLGLAPLAPRAVGVTGYAAGVLAPALGGDVHEVLETVAHARAARAAEPGVDVVCDVGGQDIKILALDGSGAIRDFRLSSQCSAGIGMVLEATARELDVPLAAYAERALAAKRAPWFGDACVVFLDANRITFQRQGFTPDEILAGLARALPRVIWTQVMNGAHPASLGRTFVLQGGVQRNRAAVLAQRDWLAAAVPGARVVVHPLAAEAGALGAALAAGDALAAGAIAARPPRPLAGATRIDVRSDEDTRCGLCANRCPRVFVSVTDAADGAAAAAAPAVHVTGHACAEGAVAVPAPGASRGVARRKRRRAPNLLAEEVKLLFAAGSPAAARHRPPRRVRVGIPRTLAMYRAAPFFRGYLEAAGVAPADVVFSPVTSPALWRAGAHHGSSDPCFPVKVSLAHVHHLLHRVHDRGRPLDVLFVPHVTHALTPVTHVRDSASCPVVAASPALVRASLGDELARRGIAIVDPLVTLTRPELLREQMFAAFAPLLALSRAASDAAVTAGLAAMRAVDDALGAAARDVLDELERTPGRGAVLVLARPYHVDPGLDHRLGEELQALGYPAFSCRAIPRDADYLRRLFQAELAAGTIADPFDVRDLAPECVNSGAAERLWAARFAARHGRLGVVDLSSFKCGQDAPLYAPVREVLDAAGVVTCSLHDLDETRPVASLRLRLRTFAHALAARGLAPAPAPEAS